MSGDTSAGALRRLPHLLSALRQRPHLAIVERGANDGLRRVPESQLRINLQTIVEELDRCGIPSLLATVEPPPFRSNLLGDYGFVHATVVDKLGLQTCPLYPEGVLGHPAMVLADSVHLDARTVALCAAHALSRVIANLDVSSAQVA